VDGGSEAHAGTTVKGAAPGSRELLLVRSALALLGLHAILDAFLAPEPGTTWADHRAAGGVTLAVLAGTAAAYPFLRAGARAVVALVLGVLSIEAACLAVVDDRHECAACTGVTRVSKSAQPAGAELAPHAADQPPLIAAITSTRERTASAVSSPARSRST
jgi:hypothetical protein